MVSFPPCKINLGLRVLRKRADGYHDLDTCFYPLPLTDILEIIPWPHQQFTTSGEGIPGDEADNLCLRAYRLLKKDFDLPPVHIHLHKIIPTGAGLGGGSADAAHTLRLLNERFQLGLAVPALMAYAAQLGSDCAFFIQDNPMLAAGRGEILTPVAISLRDFCIVLAKPAIHVSTAEAYAGLQPSQPTTTLREILEHTTPDQWKATLVNDFEESIFRKHPAIGQLKERMYNAGARYAAMSGSGASVFGIFDEEPDVDFPGHFVWRRRL